MLNHLITHIVLNLCWYSIYYNSKNNLTITYKGSKTILVV